LTTSGSWNYSLNAAQVVYAAAENLEIVSGGSTINPNDQTSMLQRLNLIAKQWQGNADMAAGLHVHTRQRITLFLSKTKKEYLIGPASTDDMATTQYGRTTLSAAAAIGTTISITSNADSTTQPGTTVTMANGDNIGIVQSDGTLFWTTISGTPGATATLASALTASATAGSYVYWFTNKSQRFPVLEYASLRDSNIMDIPLNVDSDVQQYERQPNKTASGDPTEILVEPLRLNTRITTDFIPADVTKQLRLTALYPAEDYDATTDDIAFPQEYFAALEWELTLRCAPMFRKAWTPEMDKNYINATAIARELNPENSSSFFQPGRD
jgi:hypothetical protein